MMKESTTIIYFRIQVFGSSFHQFGHLHSVGRVDFNWAEAWVIVNGHLLDAPVSAINISFPFFQMNRVQYAIPQMNLCEMRYVMSLSYHACCDKYYLN
jgi:hypothetical protein